MSSKTCVGGCSLTASPTSRSKVKVCAERWSKVVQLTSDASILACHVTCRANWSSTARNSLRAEIKSPSALERARTWDDKALCLRLYSAANCSQDIDLKSSMQGTIQSRSSSWLKLNVKIVGVNKIKNSQLNIWRSYASTGTHQVHWTLLHHPIQEREAQTKSYPTSCHVCYTLFWDDMAKVFNLRHTKSAFRHFCIQLVCSQLLKNLTQMGHMLLYVLTVDQNIIKE